MVNVEDSNTDAFDSVDKIHYGNMTLILCVPWKTFLHHRDQCTMENFLTSSLLMYRGKLSYIIVINVPWKTFLHHCY